jgi:hypothetical protein
MAGEMEIFEITNFRVVRSHGKPLLCIITLKGFNDGVLHSLFVCLFFLFY